MPVACFGLEVSFGVNHNQREWKTFSWAFYFYHSQDSREQTSVGSLSPIPLVSGAVPKNSSSLSNTRGAPHGFKRLAPPWKRDSKTLCADEPICGCCSRMVVARTVRLSQTFLRSTLCTLQSAAWGVPTASERGAESEVAHKWARWLHNPCRLGDPHRFKAGGQNQKWPTSGQGGYITPAAWGVPTASYWGKIRGGPQVGKVAT